MRTKETIVAWLGRRAATRCGSGAGPGSGGGAGSRCGSGAGCGGTGPSGGAQDGAGGSSSEEDEATVAAATTTHDDACSQSHYKIRFALHNGLVEQQICKIIVVQRSSMGGPLFIHFQRQFCSISDRREGGERLNDDDWKKLKEYWAYEECEARTIQAKANRAKLTIHHTSYIR